MIAKQNILRHAVFDADSFGIKIITAGALGGGTDTKRSENYAQTFGCLFSITLTDIAKSVPQYERLSLPGPFSFVSPGDVCFHFRTVGQNPNSPRLWRALILFERPAERLMH